MFIGTYVSTPLKIKWSSCSFKQTFKRETNESELTLDPNKHSGSFKDKVTGNTGSVDSKGMFNTVTSPYSTDYNGVINRYNGQIYFFKQAKLLETC